MFRGHPRFKGRKQEVGRNTSQNTSQQQYSKVGGVLQGIDDDLQNTVNNAGILASKFVHSTSQKRSKEGTTQESRQEKRGNVDIVTKVQRVHVGPLHPIGKHNHQVDQNVFVAESKELLIQIV